MLWSLLLLAAMQSQPIPASTAAPAPERMALGSDVGDRMTLPARINDRGPFPFTIDTAADRSVVSDALATALALPAAGSAILYGVEGRTPVGLVRLATLRIGRREHRDIAAPVLPRAALGAQGFIGLDALAGETVLLDFRHDRISFARSAAEAMVDDPQVIVVTGRSRFGQLILTDARIGRTKVYAIIDTGAQNTLGNLALRRLLGRSGPLEDKGNRVIGVSGAELPAENGSVPRIMLGGLAIERMPVAFADVDTFRRFKIDDRPAILLGMDVLRRFDRVAIDFLRRSARFRLTDLGAAPAPIHVARAAMPNPPKGTLFPLGL